MISLNKLKTISVDNANEIINLIQEGSQKIIPFGYENLTLLDVMRQYDPNWHIVHNKTLRKDKMIEVDVETPQLPGSVRNQEDYQDQSPANMTTRPEMIRINRISIPMQKLITTRSVAFLTGNGVKYESQPANDKETALFEAVKRVNDNNKMDYKNVQIATMLASETHVAELWYVVNNSTEDNTLSDTDNDFEGIQINTRGLTLRCKIIGYSLGDNLFPVFDGMGDMIAFMRKYVNFNDAGEKENVTEIYTDTIIYILKDKGDTSSLTIESKVNMIGKIPIIYYAQPAPEWLDVQHDISRYEELISNTADNNDYFANPTMIVKGDIKALGRKGETGKVLEIEPDAEVSLLESKNAIDSVKFEADTLKGIILEGTHTPDISFESMKSLGVFSGIALKMLFFDAALKVQSKLPTYGQSQQRRINFIKAALAKFDITFQLASRLIIKPVIEAFTPTNDQELITNLSMATGNQPIMSQETAVRKNPLVENADEEINLLDKQSEKELGMQLDGGANPGFKQPLKAAA